MKVLVRYIAKWLLISLLLGVLVSTVSAFFLVTLNWSGQFRTHYPWLLFLLPVGGLCIGLLYYYMGEEVSKGNNLLIANIQAPTSPIPFKMAPMIYVGTIVTHLFGGSAGREGTALQMAGSIADQLTKPFKLSGEERRILLLAAISSGFGAVFGTPLTGILFALEVVFISRVNPRSLFPLIASTLLANWTVDWWNVAHTHYPISSPTKYSVDTLLYCTVAGCIFGLCARIFSLGMHYMGKLYNTLPYPPIRPLIGGIVVLCLVLTLGTTKYCGLGVETITEAFDKPLPLFDFAFKLALTILTLSAGFKGGEVTPLFFIGATLGNALAHFLPLPLELLAGLGFVGVFAGATNTPIACTAMAIELFGWKYGGFAGLTCLAAYYLSGQSSIYSQQEVHKRAHILLGRKWDIPKFAGS